MGFLYYKKNEITFEFPPVLYLDANLLWSCSVLLFFQPHLALKYQRFLPFLRLYWCRLPLFSSWMISLNPGIVQWCFLYLTHSATELLNKWLHLTHALFKYGYNMTYIWAWSSCLEVDRITLAFKISKQKFQQNFLLRGGGERGGGEWIQYPASLKIQINIWSIKHRHQGH